MAYKNIEKRKQQMKENGKRFYQEHKGIPVEHKELLPINSCVPRCLELRKMGIVVMDRVDKCKYTGRTVTYWRIKKWLQEVMG